MCSFSSASRTRDRRTGLAVFSTDGLSGMNNHSPQDPDDTQTGTRSGRLSPPAARSVRRSPVALWLKLAALAGLTGCPIEQSPPGRPQAAVAPIRDLDREAAATGDQRATDRPVAIAAGPTDEPATTLPPLGPDAGLPNASNPLRLADRDAQGGAASDVVPEPRIETAPSAAANVGPVGTAAADGGAAEAGSGNAHIAAGETVVAAPATPALPTAKPQRTSTEGHSALESAPVAQPDSGAAPRAALPTKRQQSPGRSSIPSKSTVSSLSAGQSRSWPS